MAASLTIGSGGSAGDFAPSLAMGGLLGGAFGQACQLMLGDPRIDPAAFALVGMGAFYGGVAHVPLAALVLVCEMAGNYDLLVPLMLALGISCVALRRHSLYQAQVSTQRESPIYRPPPRSRRPRRLRCRRENADVDKAQTAVTRDLHRRRAREIRPTLPISSSSTFASRIHSPSRARAKRGTRLPQQ